jgi:cell division protein ZapA (FtsZ GTPase activity inhibitor)
MGVINVKVGSRNYQMACEDGQEKNLISVAEEFDKKVDALSRQLRTGNESLLLVMSAIMVLDEFNEYKKKFELSTDKGKNKRDEEIAEVLNTISGYLENLIEKVEKS